MPNNADVQAEAQAEIDSQPKSKDESVRIELCAFHIFAPLLLALKSCLILFATGPIARGERNQCKRSQTDRISM